MKVAIVLDKRKKLKDDTFRVSIRISEKKKKKYLPLGFNLLESQFQNGRVSNHPKEKMLNRKILDVNSKINDILNSNIDISIDKFIFKFNHGTNSKSFTEYFQEYVDRRKSSISPFTYKTWCASVRKFKTFTPNVSFDMLDVEFMKKYASFLQETVNPNTAGKHINILGNAINSAIEDGFYHQNNPVSKVRIKKQQINERLIEAEDIQKIENFLETKSKRLFDVRNYYLFSFYSGGVRFSDVAQMRLSNILDNQIVYTQQKTGKLRKVYISKKLRPIVNYYASDRKDTTGYLFPLLDKDYTNEEERVKKIQSMNAYVNKVLKELAGVLGIDTSITFHSSRHSFANYSLDKDLDVVTIQSMLGHSDLSQTQAYLRKIQQQRSDEAFKKLFDDE